MKKTNIDTFVNDVSIFIKLLNSKKKLFTSYKAAKIVFGSNDKYDIKKKEVLMRYFFEKYYKLGVIKKEKDDDKVYYYIDDEKIVFGDSVLIIEDKYFPMGTIFGMNIKDRWVFVQLE